VSDNHCHLDIADGPDGSWLETADALAACVAEAEAAGTTRKDAIREVARAARVPKRVVYDAVHKGPGDGQ
jgi:16S rRNA (cytidine1402-2'-O)-methyltransferase